MQDGITLKQEFALGSKKSFHLGLSYQLDYKRLNKVPKLLIKIVFMQINSQKVKEMKANVKELK